jgi:POT family proton-dependent oligopeptide transporter
MGFALPEAGAIYGLYTGMVYLLSLPGGWIADGILGQRRAVLYGGIIIACGHFCLALPSVTTFFAGLVLIVIGTGLLKPNVSTMVGQLYPLNDPRRDAGFSIFYIGINLGAFLAPLVCSYLGEKLNWHYGFAAAGVGMTLGVIQYWSGLRYLGNAGAAPVVNASERQRFRVWGAVFIVLLAAGAWAAVTGLLSIQMLSSSFGFLLTTIVVVLFAGLLIFGKWTRVERNRIIVIYILFAAASLFWSIYEQAGSTLNLFADRNTDRSFPGMSGGFPAGWFQAAPALYVIAIAPIFAWLWVKLGDRNPSIPAKFALGLFFGGLSFLVLVPVASKTGVSPVWLLLVYLLQTIGELCLSPVGLSAMTKLAPARIASLMMGVFFVSLSVGDYISGKLASVYETFPLPKLFGMVGLSSLAVALLLVIFLKPIKRLMGGVN